MNRNQDVTERALNPKLIYQPIQLGVHTVPGIWRYMLPGDLFALQASTGCSIPHERRATCNNCPRIQTSNFRPDYRCCTYFPRVPNFLLGLALLEGRQAAQTIQQSNVQSFLMPEGFQPSPQQWADFLADTGEDRYGRSTQVLCPMMVRSNGHCGIYGFRNAVCSTFFCYHDHGKQGEAFWEALQTTVVQVEMALGQWALQAIGFSIDDYIDRLNGLAARIKRASDRQTHHWSEVARRTAWGSHYGQELEIYRACAELILKHKDELWHIANQINIREADHFEIAGQSLVDDAHSDEIEDDFGDPERATTKPSVLWRSTLRRLQKLHEPPTGPLRLNPRVHLSVVGSRAHTIEFRIRRNSTKLVWRQELDAAEIAALRLFSPRPLSIKTAHARLAKLGSDGGGIGMPRRTPEQFIQEWYGRQVLIKT